MKKKEREILGTQVRRRRKSRKSTPRSRKKERKKERKKIII